MTKDQRVVNLLLSTRLGKIVLLYGIVKGKNGRLRCECRKWKTCKTPGKHPRGGGGWQQRSTREASLLWAWLTIYPDANHGILIDETVDALDSTTDQERTDLP